MCFLAILLLTFHKLRRWRRLRVIDVTQRSQRSLAGLNLEKWKQNTKFIQELFFFISQGIIKSIQHVLYAATFVQRLASRPGHSQRGGSHCGELNSIFLEFSFANVLFTSINFLFSTIQVIRFGHDWDPTCMKMDESLYAMAEKVKNFATIYLVDITEVPDFNKM